MVVGVRVPVGVWVGWPGFNVCVAEGVKSGGIGVALGVGVGVRLAVAVWVAVAVCVGVGGRDVLVVVGAKAVCVAKLSAAAWVAVAAFSASDGPQAGRLVIINKHAKANTITRFISHLPSTFRAEITFR